VALEEHYAELQGPEDLRVLRNDRLILRGQSVVENARLFRLRTTTHTTRSTALKHSHLHSIFLKLLIHKVVDRLLQC
jgi:hypothetical protein